MRVIVEIYAYELAGQFTSDSTTYLYFASSISSNRIFLG